MSTLERNSVQTLIPTRQRDVDNLDVCPGTSLTSRRKSDKTRRSHTISLKVQLDKEHYTSAELFCMAMQLA